MLHHAQRFDTEIIYEQIDKSDLSKKDNEFKSPHKILDFLQFADGTNNLIDISNYINCSLAETRSILKILLKQKLVAFTK